MSTETDKKPAIFVFTTAYDPFIGGAEIAVGEVVKRLKGEFRFFIFTSRFRPNLPRYEEQGGIVIRRIGLGFPFDKFLIPFLGFFVVRRYMRHTRPALFWGVMATYASGIPYLINIFRLRKPVPVVLTLQEGDSLYHIKRARLGLVEASWQAALKRTHYLTAISTFLLNLGKEFGYRGEARVIPNGVDVSVFAKEFSADELSAIRGGLGIASFEKVVITTSRLVEKNAVDITIRAVGALAKKGVQLKFLILGSGNEEKPLRRLAREEGMGTRVIFLGDVPHGEVPRYLKISDVFVRPSRSEGFGNSFIEAMAAGLPVIGTSTGGIIDFLKDEKTGLAVPTDSPAELAQAIERIISNSLLAKKLAEEGKRLAVLAYQWEEIAKNYKAVFQSVIEKNMQPAVLIATGVFGPDIGGPATYSKLLADELPARGFRTEVLPFGQVRHLPKGIRHAVYFLKILGKGRFADIIFAQDPVSVGFPAMLAAKILNKKFALKIVGDYAWEQGVARFGVGELLDGFQKTRHAFPVEALRCVQQFVVKRAVCVVPSSYLKHIVEGWGVPGRQVYVIPNAGPNNSSSFSKDEARRDLKLSGTILISVGRLVPWKGFLMLIEIMPDLIKAGPDLKLYIVGDGPGMANLAAKIKNLELEGAVFLVGKVGHGEVIRYLSAADVFLLNTGYEGFSHQIVEALSAGVPVLTTRAGGNSEIITSGKDGVLVEYNEKDQWMRAVTELLGNAHLRDTLVRAGKRRANDFNAEVMLEKTAAMFHAVLEI